MNNDYSVNNDLSHLAGTVHKWIKIKEKKKKKDKPWDDFWRFEGRQRDDVH